jgi:hypothetical protein
VEGFCGHSNELPDSIRYGKFLNQLSNYQLLKRVLKHEVTLRILFEFSYRYIFSTLLTGCDICPMTSFCVNDYELRFKTTDNLLLSVTSLSFSRQIMFCEVSELVALGGLVVSVLATGPEVRGFKPGRGRWNLRVIKSAARLPSEKRTLRAR